MFQARLNRFFEREEMDGDGRCATYLVRWTLLKFRKDVGVYLHHFVGDDWSLDLHDHPKRFISIGLWGRYREWTPEKVTTYDVWHDPDGVEIARSPERHLFDAMCGHVWRAPWVRTFPAEHIHRITLIDGKPCWTIVIVLRATRRWGFWHAGQWIPWREYVNSDAATERKSCP